MKKNKILFYILLLAIFALNITGTQATVVEFYRDTGRILVEGDFNYGYSLPSGVSVSDENLFSGTDTSVYDITFTIYGSTEQDIYYAFYYEDDVNCITHAVSGGPRGMITQGTASVDRTVRIAFDSNTPKEIRIGVILLTQSEYNDTATTITDGYTTIVYNLMGTY